ncbi:hypothetical protein MHA_0775 [Mannheimia haemolytica PHL213]|nr:hypothetical protein MHA_0775 [Mannheimia haemolytica PHL213]EEY10491.1 hypothetical protein COI_0871 [Mannheimia haemolytica serotype A2 str. OVINE]EEY12555.1 hypothetical protein COK_1364 [Mannheimia haemolytica serotype A2 str. BOVINE]
MIIAYFQKKIKARFSFHFPPTNPANFLLNCLQTAHSTIFR